MEVGSKSATPLGPASYRAGYRHAETGEVICAVEMAASIAESAVLKHSGLGIVATLDGYIKPSISATTVRGLSDERMFGAESIDELVARLLASENLRMEETTAADLAPLRQRLERSVSLVKEAIDKMQAQAVCVTAR